MTEFDVGLRDGRRLHVYEYGDPNGKVVVSITGRPAAGSCIRPTASSGRERGLRIVRYDRAGYGGSTPNPRRAVADVVADIEDVLGSIAVERYASLGGSGGCPHSLACGVRSERCLAAAMIAAPTPYPAEGLDWLGGTGEGSIDEFNAAFDGPETLERFLEHEGDEMRAATPVQMKDVKPRSCSRSTPRCSRAIARSTGSEASTALWRGASQAGATTTSPSSSRGASSCRRSACPRCSGRACRT
jgi:pimeloyl-ACP methyl ester carboxylesterase